MTSHSTTSTDRTSAGAGTDRPLGLALRRGWRCACPACGSGPMLRNYLTVRDTCPVCTEELHHHRADDGPAWATIMILGHLMAPVLLGVYTAFRPEGWVMALGFSVVFIVLALLLLPRIKGMFVALQWSRRMHGFGTEGRDNALALQHD